MVYTREQGKTKVATTWHKQDEMTKNYMEGRHNYTTAKDYVKLTHK